MSSARARPSATLYYEAHTDAGQLAISRVRLAGPRVSTQVVALPNVGVFGIAVAGGYVYWVTEAGPHDRGAIMRATAAGADVRQVVGGLAAERGHLFFSRCPDDAIGRVDLSRRQVTQRFIVTGARSCPQGLAVAGGRIYWTQLGSGTIGRARLGGGRGNGRWLNIHSDQGPFSDRRRYGAHQAPARRPAARRATIGR